jgi:hypothetical protein
MSFLYFLYLSKLCGTLIHSTFQLCVLYCIGFTSCECLLIMTRERVMINKGYRVFLQISGLKYAYHKRIPTFRM